MEIAIFIYTLKTDRSASGEILTVFSLENTCLFALDYEIICSVVRDRPFHFSPFTEVTYHD